MDTMGRLKRFRNHNPTNTSLHTKKIREVSWASSVQFFLFLRRMAGPPVGSAMPARHSMQTTYRLKGGAQARQTRRGNEPRSQHKHSAKIPIKNSLQQKYTFSSRHNKNVQTSEVGTHRSRNRGTFIIRNTQFMPFNYG